MHFDISIQHIVESNFKFIVYLSRKPVVGVTPEESYDEKYLFTNLTEQVKLNLKYGQRLADQSKCNKVQTELRNNNPEAQNEPTKSQSQLIRIFENENDLNKSKQSETSTFRKSNNRTPNSSCNFKK